MWIILGVVVNGFCESATNNGNEQMPMFGGTLINCGISRQRARESERGERFGPRASPINYSISDTWRLCRQIILK